MDHKQVRKSRTGLLIRMLAVPVRGASDYSQDDNIISSFSVHSWQSLHIACSAFHCVMAFSTLLFLSIHKNLGIFATKCATTSSWSNATYHPSGQMIDFHMYNNYTCSQLVILLLDAIVRRPDGRALRPDGGEQLQPGARTRRDEVVHHRPIC